MLQNLVHGEHKVSAFEIRAVRHLIANTLWPTYAFYAAEAIDIEIAAVA